MPPHWPIKREDCVADVMRCLHTAAMPQWRRLCFRLPMPVDWAGPVLLTHLLGSHPCSPCVQTVMVYRLITANTVDQRILERAESKRKLERLGEYCYPDCAAAAAASHIEAKCLITMGYWRASSIAPAVIYKKKFKGQGKDEHALTKSGVQERETDRERERACVCVCVRVWAVVHCFFVTDRSIVLIAGVVADAAYVW